MSLGMDMRSAGVVGSGTMGAGIAEVLARAGLTVTAAEADPDALSPPLLREYAIGGLPATEGGAS